MASSHETVQGHVQLYNGERGEGDQLQIIYTTSDDICVSFFLYLLPLCSWPIKNEHQNPQCLFSHLAPDSRTFITPSEAIENKNSVKRRCSLLSLWWGIVLHPNDANFRGLRALKKIYIKLRRQFGLFNGKLYNFLMLCLENIFCKLQTFIITVPHQR